MRTIYTAVLSTFLLFSVPVLAKIDRQYWAQWDRSDENNGASIDHAAFHRLLQSHVITNHPSGINRFDYPSLDRADRKGLNSYIKKLSSLDPRAYRKVEQKAYWLNLYNALTIREVLEAYPVESMEKSRYQDKKLVSVAKTKLSLNDIENRILRPIWRDHKVIFGLSCAALGCPHIQNQAFTAANSSQLLKKATREFINHPRGLALNKQELKASKIFDWYRDDFGAEDKKLMKLFAYYADDSKALYLLGFSGDISYNYDSRINAPETVWPVNQ